jgi:hypothetical protein
VVKKNIEDGKYKNPIEAESDVRQLVVREEACKYAALFVALRSR